MSKVKITALISVKKETTEEPISSILEKNFSNKEIGNISGRNGFVSLEVYNVLDIPTLMELFSALQLFVNGNPVNMSMLK